MAPRVAFAVYKLGEFVARATLYWTADTNIGTRLLFAPAEPLPVWSSVTPTTATAFVFPLFQNAGLVSNNVLLVELEKQKLEAVVEVGINRLAESLFGPEPTDGVVPVSSALAGSKGPGRYLIDGLSHDLSTPKNLGLTGDSLLDDPRVADQILKLLNSSTGDRLAFARD
jgi:hypothetical protein